MDYQLNHLEKPAESPVDSDREDKTLDDFIHRKSRIQGSKLDVLAAEIVARLGLRRTNLERIVEDKDRLRDMIGNTSRLANYGLRDQRDVTRMSQGLFDLDAERRKQDVDSWKDVVMVLRDFLYTWEAHEEARSRAMLLNDAG
jgi:ribosomal protein L30/L7E